MFVTAHRRFLIATLLVVASASPALAQKPDLGYAFPPVVAAGKTTVVALGGYDLTPDMQWFALDDRVKLEVTGPPGDYHLPPPPYWSGQRTSLPARPIPREVPARVTVAADAPAGLLRWQAANANGSTSTAMLLVSRDREIVEARSRELPQRLPALPVAVSGRLARLTEVDRYELIAERDGPIAVELFARRLGVDMHGILQVRDDAGRLVADLADTQGLDGTLVFTAVAGKRYTVSLHDVDFRGDRAFVYRLAFTNHHPRVAVAPEPQSPPNQTIHLAAPVARTCQFSPDATEHRFTCDAAANEDWSVAALSLAIGGRVDVALEVLDPAGKRIADHDDAASTTDALARWRTTVGGRHTVVVRAMSPLAGDARDSYRLELARESPGFTLTMPQQLDLPLGGQGEIAIGCERRGGFSGPVMLAITGLPPGITMTGPLVIPADKKDVAKIALKSAANAAAVASLVRITGAAEINGQQVTQRALASAGGGNLCPLVPAERLVDRLVVAITMPAPFEIKLVDLERQRVVPRGTTYPAEFTIERKPGFTGPLQLEMAAQQQRYRQGMRGGIVPVSADAASALYPCFMPESLGTDLTCRMIVHGVAPVRDPQGNVRYLARPATGKITMIVDGALLKLATPAGEPTLRPGQTLDLPVTIARSAKLSLPVTIEIVPPAELAGSLQAAPLTLPPTADHGRLRLALAATTTAAGPFPLRVKATALQDNRWPVISEAEVTLTIAGPEGSPR